MVERLSEGDIEGVWDRLVSPAQRLRIQEVTARQHAQGVLSDYFHKLKTGDEGWDVPELKEERRCILFFCATELVRRGGGWYIWPDWFKGELLN
jgi:hypothetical protein